MTDAGLLKQQTQTTFKRARTPLPPYLPGVEYTVGAGDGTKGTNYIDGGWAERAGANRWSGLVSLGRLTSGLTPLVRENRRSAPDDGVW